MKMRVEQLYGRPVFMQQVDAGTLQSDIVYRTGVTYNENNTLLIDALAWLYDSVQQDDHQSEWFVLYEQSAFFKHVFVAGVEIELKMLLLRHFRNDVAEHEMDQFFNTVLRAKLANRMPECYLSVYLDSLRASIISPSPRVDSLIVENKLPVDLTHKYNDMRYLEQCIDNLSNAEINRIINIIVQNEISSSVSSNTFNLHKTEPQQQRALSFKAIRANAPERHDISEDHIWLLSASELFGNGRATSAAQPPPLLSVEVGKMYVFSQLEPVVFIRMDMKYDKFIRLITTSSIIGFNIYDDQTSHISVGLCMYQSVFLRFSERVNNGQIVQFSYINSVPVHDFLFRNNIGMRTWQSGNPSLLGLDNFSEETLVSTSRCFEIYGIFCHHALTRLANCGAQSLVVKLIVSYGRYKFYYANISFHRHRRFAFFSDFLNANQTTGQCPHHSEATPNNELETMWALRPCFHLIYHKYFEWINEATANSASTTSNAAPVTLDGVLMQAAIANIINYKYIKDTGSLNITPRDQSDSITLMQITIETHRNVYRDMFDCKKIIKSAGVRFTQFNGSKDGPLVSAVSVRSCEKLTNPLLMDREWNVNVINLSSLLNVPNYKCTQNIDNKIAF